MQLTANRRYIQPHLFPTTVQDQYLSIISKSLLDYINIYKMLWLTWCPEVKSSVPHLKKENTVSRSLLIQEQFQNTTQVRFLWQQGFCLKEKCHGMAHVPWQSSFNALIWDLSSGKTTSSAISRPHAKSTSDLFYPSSFNLKTSIGKI